MTSATTTESKESIVSYEQQHRCPLCGSKNYTIGAEHHDLLQPAAMPANMIHMQANVAYTSALCEDCGVSFNINGLSDATREAITSSNYAFLKPSTGVGALNYTPYIDLICKYLTDKDMSFAEIGGYDGYTPKSLAERGYTDLTLIEPSPHVDEQLIAQGKLKVYQGYFPDADPVWEYKDDDYALREPHLYDMITARDVLQMLSNPQELVNAANLCLKKGGIAIFSSSQLNVMHPQQKLHLGLNAYKRLAQFGGFSLVESIQPFPNSTVYYVMRKVFDLSSEKAKAQEYGDKTKDSAEEFEKEQSIQRKLIKQNHQTSDTGIAKLNDAVARHHNAGHEIIIYGTGYLCSEFMNCIESNLDELNLTLVNSSEEQEGYVYLRPDNKVNLVHYAGTYLKDKHVPLIVLAVGSTMFKEEIELFLKDINCTCDELLYVYD